MITVTQGQLCDITVTESHKKRNKSLLGPSMSYIASSIWMSQIVWWILWLSVTKKRNHCQNKGFLAQLTVFSTNFEWQQPWKILFEMESRINTVDKW